MLINSAEYEAMYRTESELWWYRILHLKVLRSISSHFPSNKNIEILDAGCGTGGMLQSLKNEGYHHIKGFDFSVDAVRLCKTRGLDVEQFSLLEKEEATKQYDVVICNDVLYQFDDAEMLQAFQNLSSKVKKGGVLISNNQAFEAFRGTHDIAVGSKRRFVISDFRSFLTKHGLRLSIQTYNYWSLLLSPLIFGVRLLQRIQLRLGMIDLNNIKSDVGLPPNFINQFFFRLVKFEDRFLHKHLFGSSLFITFNKD